MHLSSSAIVCAVRPHGEHGAIVRCLTQEAGLIAGYVQGARSRMMRPVLIPGNEIKGDWRVRTAGQLPGLTVESLHSRAHLLSEPLATAGMEWATVLTASTLPEAHPYPPLFEALQGLLAAIELAPAARGWANAMARFEELLLAELGYGDQLAEPEASNEWLARNRKRLVEHIVGAHHNDIMASRERLAARLKKAHG